MGDTLPKFTAAAVQAEPIFLDRDATVDKACELIATAGKAGAALIVFPETWIPGYPVLAHHSRRVLRRDVRRTLEERRRITVDLHKPPRAGGKDGECVRRDRYQRTRHRFARHALQHAAVPLAGRRCDAQAPQAHADVHRAHGVGLRGRKRSRRPRDTARPSRRADLLGAPDDARQVRAIRPGRAGALCGLARLHIPERSH